MTDLAEFITAQVVADGGGDAILGIVEAHPWMYSDPYESWKDDSYRAKWGDDRDNRLCLTCGGVDYHPNLGAGWNRASWPCQTLRFTGLIYSNRPGYKKEWLPQ